MTQLTKKTDKKVAFSSPIISDMEIDPVEDPNVKLETSEQDNINQSILNNRYCDKCKQEFTSTGKYLIHYLNAHGVQFKVEVMPTKGLDSLPDEDDPNFYCRVCDVKFHDKRKYRTHLIGFHNMTLKPPPIILQRQRIKQLSYIKPDPQDPDRYCCVCQEAYSCKSSYLNHLKRLHGMDVSRYRFYAIVNPHLTPDPNDPNRHCCACDKTFLRKQNYSAHLERIHGILRESKKKDIAEQDPENLPDIEDPDNAYCKVCDQNFPTRGNFEGHCRAIHHMFVKPNNIMYTRLRNAHLTPDENDPNFHCIVCEKKYKNEKTYRTHLRIVHDFQLEPKKFWKLPVEINVDDDTNTYCIACEKKFVDREKFLSHLRVKHYTNIGPDQNLSNPILTNPSTQDDEDVVLPDEDNPDFYCNVCDKCSPNKHTFHKHIEKVHNVKLKNKCEKSFQEHIDNSIKSQSISTIDCKVCGKVYKNALSCKKHFKKQHGIEDNTKFGSGEVYRYSIKHPERTPDIHHPNHYCCACERKFANRSSFRRHLVVLHQIEIKNRITRSVRGKYVFARPDLTPDIDDPKFFCATCQRKYSCKFYYREHLQDKHNISIKSNKKIK